jgi:HSP20 family protein
MLTLVPYRRYRNGLTSTRNSLFDDQFFRSFFNMSDAMGSSGFRVDIREKDNAYIMSAELPGVPMDKINLSVNDDMLTISADIDTQKEDDQGSYYYCERRSGHVERSFNLENIDQDQIKASYENGILNLTLPKRQPMPEKSARRIPIDGAKVEALEEVQPKT